MAFCKWFTHMNKQRVAIDHTHCGWMLTEIEADWQPKDTHTHTHTLTWSQGVLLRVNASMGPLPCGQCKRLGSALRPGINKLNIDVANAAYLEILTPHRTHRRPCATMPQPLKYVHVPYAYVLNLSRK